MRYYIYFHYREDCEFPFYIGKGQGNRVYESRCGDPQRCYTCRVRCHKCSTILYCQANDIAVWSDWPIFETDDGDEINQAETAWIAYGREQGWPLTNIADGGDSWSWTEEQRHAAKQRGISYDATHPELREMQRQRKLEWLRSHPEFGEVHSQNQAARWTDEELRDAERRRANVWRDAHPESIVADRERMLSLRSTPEFQAAQVGAVAKVYRGFMSPEGIPYIDIFNLRAFCREHRLHNADMSDLYVGGCNQYKGWRRLTDEEYNYYKLLPEGE